MLFFFCGWWFFFVDACSKFLEITFDTSALSQELSKIVNSDDDDDDDDNNNNYDDNNKNNNNSKNKKGHGLNIALKFDWIKLNIIFDVLRWLFHSVIWFEL